MGLWMALKIDRNFENVNVLSLTLVRLYRARPRLFNFELWAINLTVLCLIRLTNNWASKNLKVVFESTVLFII